MEREGPGGGVGHVCLGCRFRATWELFLPTTPLSLTLVSDVTLASLCLFFVSKDVRLVTSEVTMARLGSRLGNFRACFPS